MLVIDSASATLVEAPSKWAVVRVAVAATIATVALIALVGGAYMVYDAKTTEISQLKQDGQHLRAANETLTTKNETLRGQLATTHSTLRNTNAKLTTTTKKLRVTKKAVTKLRGDLGAANERAVANYGAGYSQGNSEGYGAGNSAGYSSGHEAGLVDGSDSLTCSDDPDVTWLPACYDY